MQPAYAGVLPGVSILNNEAVVFEGSSGTWLSLETVKVSILNNEAVVFEEKGSMGAVRLDTLVSILNNEAVVFEEENVQ